MCVQTSRNLLHLYSLHITKEALFPSRGNLGVQRDLRRVEVYIKHTASLGDVAATCVYSNSTGVLLGMQDGTLATYNWLGKVSQDGACSTHASAPAAARLPYPIPAMP